MVGPRIGELVFPAKVDGDRVRGLPGSVGRRSSSLLESIGFNSLPLGWECDSAFERLFPPVRLPFQVVHRLERGRPDLEPNRLILGDNLHVMRQLPSRSIDLIYIDPPFFSGRNHRSRSRDPRPVGDRSREDTELGSEKEREVRSFSDVWEEGLPGYLVWLNARLFEMRRLLKPTGSIMVHCDLHASHYIKVELDKLFGTKTFQNEIVWSYRSGGGTKRRYGRKHDVILWYSNSPKDYCFNADEVRVPYDAVIAKSRRSSFNEKGKVEGSVWDISRPPNHSREWLGYPTQKPEALLQRIIKAHSRPGDLVADFFCGAGTTAVVASRLGRRWIACDESSSAVSLTFDRLARAADAQGLDREPARDITMERWGIYRFELLAIAPPTQFRRFVIRAIGAEEKEDHQGIHGLLADTSVWIGPPDPRELVTEEEVRAFARAVVERTDVAAKTGPRGVMLAWGFRPSAAEMAKEVGRRPSRGSGLMELELIRIGSQRFLELGGLFSSVDADNAELLYLHGRPKSLNQRS